MDIEQLAYKVIEKIKALPSKVKHISADRDINIKAATYN